jgi:lysyl endopeptidase
MRHFAAVSLVATLLCWSTSSLSQQAFGEPAWDEPVSALPSAYRDATYPVPKALGVQLPALPPARVAALRAANAQDRSRRLRIGIERDVAEHVALPKDVLAWHGTADGGWTARLAATSTGAAALRLGVDLSGLPDQAELRVFSQGASLSATAAISGAAINAARSVHPVFWTPVTEGETQIAELYLPPGSDPEWIRGSLASLSHLLVSPLRAIDRRKVGAQSEECHIDVRCESNPTQAFSNASKAVASMVFQVDGESSVCSGTLLNDTDTSTQVPYFFSAAHCFTSQAVANTLTTLWFYESTSCDSGVTDEAGTRQVAGGAQILHADVPSDVLLLKINGAVPQGATFSGWDATAITAGSPALIIHHPAGDVKKFSLGQIRGTGPSTLASGSFIQVRYASAPTEGGSSGSGLLTQAQGQFLLRGGLLGGSSACANVGDLNNADNEDDYSRFDLAFASLKQFLQPQATTPPAGTNFAGAWFNPDQSGWGLVVVGGPSLYAMYIYHYGQNSAPVWYLSVGTLQGATYNQALSAYTGPWFGITPFDRTAVNDRIAGDINVTFASPTSATIRFTVDGRTVTSNLTKLL